MTDDLLPRLVAARDFLAAQAVANPAALDIFLRIDVEVLELEAARQTDPVARARALAATLRQRANA